MKDLLLAERYELLEELGRGGRGVVYLAHDRRLARRVAVKWIHPEILSVDRERDFMAEARAVARLNHPAITPIYDLCRHDESFFIVMPVLAGRTLRALMVSGTLSVEKTLRIGAQVAAALDHSHNAGVVHRDVKPENVMVLDEGGHLQVKVLDFGLAVQIEASVSDTGGFLEGTPSYLSPEQVEGRRVDGRTDIYALGVVLYECLAGEPPFRGRGIHLLREIVEDKPPSLRSKGAAVDPALERLILSCLAKNPTQRPASAFELASELLRLTPSSSTSETAALLGNLSEMLPLADPQAVEHLRSLLQRALTEKQRARRPPSHVVQDTVRLG